MKNAFLILSLFCFAVAVKASTSPVGAHCFATYDRCLSCGDGECIQSSSAHSGERFAVATASECEVAARESLAVDTVGLFRARVSFRAQPEDETIRTEVLRGEMCKTVFPR